MRNVVVLAYVQHQNLFMDQNLNKSLARNYQNNALQADVLSHRMSSTTVP